MLVNGGYGRDPFIKSMWCSKIYGQVIFHELVIHYCFLGRVRTNIAFDFIQSCLDEPEYMNIPPLYGSVRYNSTIPITNLTSLMILNGGGDNSGTEIMSTTTTTTTSTNSAEKKKEVPPTHHHQRMMLLLPSKVDEGRHHCHQIRHRLDRNNSQGWSHGGGLYANNKPVGGLRVIKSW